MKKIYTVFVSILLINIIYAHQQDTHQYIVREAYKLLLLDLGLSTVPDLSSHIGVTQGRNDTGPFKSPFVVAGTWNEDEQDPVYQINWPTPTNTHFWEANIGDGINTSTYLAYPAWLGGTLGPYANAYQKAKKYLNGGWTLHYQASEYLYLEFTYNSLLEVYQYHRLYVTYISDILGQNTHYDPPRHIQEFVNENVFSQEFVDQIISTVTYNILGRIAHLIADMSMPAHAHRDQHFSPSDPYEDLMSEGNSFTTYWNANNTFAQKGGIINVYNHPTYDHPIYTLMYSMNQIADHFASNNVSGNDFFNDIGNLISSNFPYGLSPTTVNEYANNPNLTNIRDATFTYAIRATAGLLYWFAVEVGLVNRVTLKNNFNAGTIKFNQETLQSGNVKTILSGDSHILTALHQPYNNHDYIWSTTAPINKSKWKKFDKDGYELTINNNLNITYNLNVTPGEYDVTYEAGLRKNYKNTVSHQTEFDGTQSNQQTVYVVEQNGAQIYAPLTKNVNGKLYNFAGWSDILTPLSPRTIWPEDNTNYTALYKLVQKSNNQNAYSNNSQRKFVRMNNGKLYSTYESMNCVWLESSTNNGQTWIREGGPISSNGKCPSLFTDGNYLVITYQEGYEKIKVVSYDPYGPLYQVGWDIIPDNPQNKLLYPVTAFSVSGNSIVTMYEENSEIGIYWGHLTYLGNHLEAIWDSWGGFPNAITPSLSSYGIYYHFAYSTTNQSSIKYIKFHINGVEAFIDEGIGCCEGIDLSFNSGFSKHYNPTIISVSDDGPKVCWIAYRKGAAPDNPSGGGELPFGETKVFFKSKNNGVWSAFNSYGSSINTVNINKNIDNTFAFAWSEGNSNKNKFVRSDHLTNIYTTNTTGRYLMVGNYQNLNSMRLNSFTTATIPYSFSLSNTFDIIPHDEEVERDGIIVKDTTAFYFSLGNIFVDDENVDFVAVPDTTNINNKETLNSYLLSEPFTLNDYTSFFYSVQFGVTDSVSAVESLVGGKAVNFKVQLIDDQTGDIIGTFDDVTFNSENVIPYENISYEVNTEGIGNKTCRLKLIADDNIEFNYSLVNSYNNETILGKKGLVKRTIDGLEAVKIYDLAQNYPNPFNPITTIKYQIPKDGMVSMKIYDILGKEIKTLVNEQKSIGRYEIDFDASDLASGVYIYRIQVNDYVSSKKMMLLK